MVWHGNPFPACLFSILRTHQRLMQTTTWEDVSIRHLEQPEHGRFENSRLNDSTGVYPDAVITWSIQMHSGPSKLEALACGTGSGSLSPLDDEALSDKTTSAESTRGQGAKGPLQRPRGLWLSPATRRGTPALALGLWGSEALAWSL